MKRFLTCLSLLLAPALGVGVLSASDVTPETGEVDVAPRNEVPAESVAASPLARWMSFLPFVESESPASPAVAEAPSPEPAPVAPSASALARLGEDPNAIPLQDGPRRATSFFFDVPGLDTVEVSPN